MNMNRHLSYLHCLCISAESTNNVQWHLSPRHVIPELQMLLGQCQHLANHLLGRCGPAKVAPHDDQHAQVAAQHQRKWSSDRCPWQTYINLCTKSFAYLHHPRHGVCQYLWQELNIRHTGVALFIKVNRGAAPNEAICWHQTLDGVNLQHKYEMAL